MGAGAGREENAGEPLDCSHAELRRASTSPHTRRWHRNAQVWALAALALPLGTWRSQKLDRADLGHLFFVSELCRRFPVIRGPSLCFQIVKFSFSLTQAVSMMALAHRRERSPLCELCALSQALNYTRPFILHGSTLSGVPSCPRCAEKGTEPRE